MKSFCWWENYLVRYLVGTIVGALCIVALNESSQSPLYKFLFPTIFSSNSAGPNHFFVLAALGFAFCYIASAPILVFHALRSELKLANGRKSTGLLFFSILLAALLFLLANILFKRSTNWDSASAALLTTSFVIAVQASLFFSGIRSGFQSTRDFYTRLATNRATRQRAQQEYIESYRHLREHGNAFLIIVFELCLAFGCVEAQSIPHLLALLTLWIAPAAAVWLVGTAIEHKLT